ncbi:MAG: cytochrome b [Elsteraceae bacterium]
MTRWPRAIRAMHWAMALFMFLALGTGLIMEDLPGGAWQNLTYNLHRSFGVTVLVLVVIRIGLRLALGAPPEARFSSPFQAFAAKITHKLFYVTGVAMPVVGWVGTSAFGAPVIVYGLVTLPPLVAKSKPLADWTLGLHEAIGNAIMILIVAHVAGALYHHFFLKDGLIRRMWPL